jgi:hypothetical protein
LSTEYCAANAHGYLGKIRCDRLHALDHMGADLGSGGRGYTLIKLSNYRRASHSFQICEGRDSIIYSCIN